MAAGQSTYTASRFGENSCADGTSPVTTREECVVAATSLDGNLKHLIYLGREAATDMYKQHGTIQAWKDGTSVATWPKGCTHSRGNVFYWNAHSAGSAHQQGSPVCKQSGEWKQKSPTGCFCECACVCTCVCSGVCACMFVMRLECDRPRCKVP